MNHVFSVFLFAILLSSCSSDEVVDSPLEEEKEVVVEKEAPKNEEKEKSYLFKSDEEGVVEYMRCTVMLDGTQFWTYFSEKNEKEVKLGRTDKDGLEAVYFLGKPEELYVIGSSECGFTLSDETRQTSQWYGQYLPNCADDLF